MKIRNMSSLAVKKLFLKCKHPPNVYIIQKQLSCLLFPLGKMLILKQPVFR